MRAAILTMVSCPAASVVLMANEFGNLEVRFPDHALSMDWLYTIPGSVIFFAMPGHAFNVTRYRLEGDGLCPGETLWVEPGAPVLLDGRKELFCLDGHQDSKTVILSFNYPDPSRDIEIYCKRTLRKFSWLPADNSAQRMLVGLEAMQLIEDPQLLTVASELAQHLHPEVRRAAVKLLADHKQNAPKDRYQAGQSTRYTLPERDREAGL